MKNCITTKLKETVTGSGFFKSGELVFKLFATEDCWIWWLSQYSAVTNASLEGGAYFVASEGSTVSLGPTSAVAGEGKSIFVPKGEHFLKIADKTKLTQIGAADFPSWTLQNFISSTSSSFRVELYGETLKYATNITSIILNLPYYRFYELGSIFKNKTIVKAIITAENALIGTIEDLFSDSGKIDALELRNQLKLTGDTSALAGKEILLWESSNNSFDINLNDFYSVKGGQLTITEHKGKVRGNPLNLNNAVAFVSLLESADVLLDNDNLITPRSYIISGEFLKFASPGDVDNFLIANSAKPAHPDLSSLPVWVSSINILGARTSASNAAVSTLANKGYTVNTTVVN